MIQLSYQEMQAVMKYLKALENGDEAPPESVGVLDEEILDAIRRAKDFQVYIGELDHEHVAMVVQLMYERSPDWASSATDYMPSTAIH